MKRIIVLFIVGILLGWFSTGWVIHAYQTPPPIVHGIHLQWVAVTGGSSYTIYRGTTISGPWSIVVNTPTPDFVDPVSGLTPGTTYFYVIRVVNSMGVEGANGNTASATVAGPPGVVTTLTATPQ